MSALLARRNASRYLAARIESVLSTSRDRRFIHHQIYCVPSCSCRADVDVGKQLRRTFSNQASSSSSKSTPSLAQLATNEELTEIVNLFPPNISYAFGYGSGVLRQQPSDTNGVKSNPGMVDIILATDNPYEWHTHNLQRHLDHYSLMARGGPHFVTWLQVNFGAKLYFHPFVDVELEVDGGANADNKHTQSSKERIKREIKYGVVSTDDLISDLRNWDYLYLAGRMHKPIVSIELPQRFRKYEQSNGHIGIGVERRDEIEDAQRANLLSAVSASLLLRDTSNNEQSPSDSLQSIPVGQLYTTIAGLSYTGDIRMQTGAEDPNKVQKLVETPGMSNLWDDMYAETLGKLQSMGLVSLVSDNVDGKHLECGLSDMAARKQLVQNLPPRLRKRSDQIVAAAGNEKGSIQHGSAVLRQELTNIVAPAAKSQSIKGFFTAGMMKSWYYAMAKFKKGRVK